MRMINADTLKECYIGDNTKTADYLSIRTMIDNQPTIGLISCEDRLPYMELLRDRGYLKEYLSKKVLVYTRTNEFYIAECFKEYSKYNSKPKIEWFSYGTGGRRMTVKSKVLYWMPLPEVPEQ